MRRERRMRRGALDGLRIWVVAACMALSVDVPAKPKDTRPLLAVLSVTAGAGFGKEELSSLEEVLLSALGHTDKFQVIGHADIQSLLDVEKQKQIAGCNDDSGCIAGIAGALGATYVGAAHVGRIGTATVLSFRIVVTRDASVILHTQQTVHEDAELIPACDQIAREAVSAIFPSSETTTAPARQSSASQALLHQEAARSASADTVAARSSRGDVFESNGREWATRPAPAPMTGSDAISYCADLQLAGGGWRLPESTELQALYGEKARTKKFSHLPGMNAGTYWSSSFYGEHQVWVDFGHNGSNWGPPADYNYLVRCVRWPAGSGESGAVAGDVFQYDGAEWMTRPAPLRMTGGDAIEYCRKLSLAGGGWRLPERDELLKLYEGKSTVTQGGRVIPGLDAGIYWSSSLYTSHQVWYDFANNGTNWGPPTSYHYLVRCVRWARG